MRPLALLNTIYLFRFISFLIFTHIMERHSAILKKLSIEKYVEVLDLCESLGVSAVTIRKDLKLLEQKGLLFRTHGGASLENPYINERTVLDKEKIFVAEKNGIAEMAASLISENDAIMIASGTTVQALSKYIEPKNKLTVITPSLAVVMHLIKHENIEILQLGGYLRHSAASVIGNYAEYMLEHISCSKLFLGVDGIDMNYGISTTNLEEAALNKKMIDAAQKVIVLADASKFGKKSFAKICGLSAIDEIITDQEISKTFRKKLLENEVKITVVGR